jgi:hypothetical protein
MTQVLGAFLTNMTRGRDAFLTLMTPPGGGGGWSRGRDRPSCGPRKGGPATDSDGATLRLPPVAVLRTWAPRPAGPWYKKALEREWRAACAAVGVTSTLYEGTKHSTATAMLRRGVQERTIQALLSHRDARSTRRYARLGDQALVKRYPTDTRKGQNPSKSSPAEF